MLSLSLEKAHTYVLQVLDELKNSDDMPMLVEAEGLDTYKLTEGNIVEAALKAHKDAPSRLIDGIVGTQKVDYSVTFDTDGKVATIVMLQDSARLASLKASDSNFVVTNYADEESTIGRMQHNEYVRGTYDDPRLIIKKVWTNDRRPEYIYYCTQGNKATFTVEYVPYFEVMGDSIDICDKMEYAVLTLLAAMVLDALSLHDKANLYRTRYQEYLQTTR